MERSRCTPRDIVQSRFGTVAFGCEIGIYVQWIFAGIDEWIQATRYQDSNKRLIRRSKPVECIIIRLIEQIVETVPRPRVINFTGPAVRQRSHESSRKGAGQRGDRERHRHGGRKMNKDGLLKGIRRRAGWYIPLIIRYWIIEARSVVFFDLYFTKRFN